MNDGGSRPFYRVLVLDGGGIRGYYSAQLLSHLARRSATGCGTAAIDLGAAFDLVCGTSAGAILACVLAAGLPVENAAELYRREGPTIFPHPSPIDWHSLWWCARHWRAPTSNAAALRAALERTFGDETLGTLYRRRGIALCLTTTDLPDCRLRVLRTPHRVPDDGETSLVDACMASAAAPILFPPVRLPAAPAASRAELLCDGGVAANNPILVALIEAHALADAGKEIQLFSVSSCASIGRQRGEKGTSHGLGYWVNGLRMVHVALDTQSSAAVEYARWLALRLQPPARVVRLLDPPLSSEEADLLRIDNAAPEAFAAMDRLALAAAELNLEHAERGDDLALLPEIFRGAPIAAPGMGS